MIYKKLLKNIENKSITVERINTQSPLEYNNDILSINENVLNQWNNYQNDIANLTAQNTQQQEQINTIKTDQGDLGDQVQVIQGQQNINTNDISSLKTKDKQQDTQIEQNTNNINTINTKFNDYYTKQDWSNYSVDNVKTNVINIGYDNLKIDNYKNIEITLTAPRKVTNITTGDNGIEQFRTETRTDGFYINNIKTIPTYEIFNLDNSNKVIDLGNKRKLLIFRFVWPSGNGTDAWDNLPKEIKNVNNIAYIEQVDFNMYDSGIVYSSIDCYPKVGIEAGRLYITRTSASSSYWNGKQARFRVVIVTT